MSITINRLRLPSCIPAFLAPAAVASSSTASFHTSTTAQESKRKIIARQKKAKNLALREDRLRKDARDLIDPIMGDIKPDVRAGSFMNRQSAATKSEGSTPGERFEKSLLNRVVLDRNEIWYSQPPQYPAQASSSTTFPASIQPEHYGHSFTSPSDLNLVLKHLPETSLSQTDAARASARGDVMTDEQRYEYEQEVAKESKLSEGVMRVLDLRNADAGGIKRENIRRIVEVFGGDLNEVTSSAESDAVPRMNTGHPTVVSAILTHRIHVLAEHLKTNPRDVHNKKHLREMVHQRAKVLKYYKKRVSRKGGDGEQAYLGLLEKLGLDRRGVEGELIVR